MAGGVYEITCVSMGNPHCVVFVDRVDEVDVETIGPRFEYDCLFPERVNTEFIRVVNDNTIDYIYRRSAVDRTDTADAHLRSGTRLSTV